MDIIITELSQLKFLEVLAVVFGVVYVILAAKEIRWCWIFGIVSCAICAYATFTYYALWADAVLQLFYVVMGFVGWHSWRAKKESAPTLAISTMVWKQHFILFLLGSFLALIIGFLLQSYTEAAATYLDSWTTVMAIVATFLTINKKLENWIYWLLVNAIYVYLYISREAWLFALLSVVYFIIAVYGYRTWTRKFQQNQTVVPPLV